MKNSILLLVYLSLCIALSSCNSGSQSHNSLNNYIQTYQTKFADENGPIDDMEPGVGYSSDAEHIAPSACFKPLRVTKSSHAAELLSNTSLDKTELIKKLNLGFNLKGGYAQFGANATLNYIIENNSNDLAISYNFVSTISRKVSIEYAPILRKILNETGVDVYDSGNNDLFRLYCGDKLIDGYTEGAFVITTVSVVINNKVQKKNFEAGLGGNVSGFADLSAKISSYRQRSDINGEVIISAFQLGGDPTQLFKIMPTSMSCSFDKLELCEKLYSTGIATYIKNDLPTQFGQESSYTPLGNLSFSPISLTGLGMKIASSYVTKNITDARNLLLKLYKQNQENYRALYDVLYYYPVKLEPNFNKEVDSSLRIARNNLDILQNAKLCWISPSECLDTYKSILNDLHEQKNKYLISDFPPSAYQFDGRLRTIPKWTFYAKYYPSSTTTYTLLPLQQAYIDPTQRHLPITGFNEGGTYDFYGESYDWRCGNRYSSYRIVPASNGAWSLQWTHCSGEYRSFDGVLQQTTLPSYAELYNFILH